MSTDNDRMSSSVETHRQLREILSIAIIGVWASHTRGCYLLEKPLVLPTDTILIGLARHLTVFVSAFDGAQDMNPSFLVDVQGDNVILNAVTIEPFLHQSVSGFRSSSNGLLLRDAYVHRKNMCGSWWDEYCTKVYFNGYIMNRPQMVFTGSSAHTQQWILFQEDYIHQGPGYRHVSIQDMHGSYTCYQCNVEHARGDANMEITNSSNVTMYSIKSEGNYAVLWVRNSSNVYLSGYGGNAAAFPYNSKYPAGYTQLPPSLFRVQNSSVTLGLLIDQSRNAASDPASFPGTGVPADKWRMVWSDDEAQIASALERPALYVATTTQSS